MLPRRSPRSTTGTSTTSAPATAAPSGRPVGHLVRAGLHVQGGPDVPGVDGPARRVGHGRQQVRRVGAVAQPTAELGQRLVRRGRRPEGQPVGDTHHPAPERLEGQGHHGGRHQGRPEAVGPALDEQTDQDDDRHVADGHHARGEREDQGPVERPGRWRCSRCRSTAIATHTGTAAWATRSGSAASHVPSSPWRRGTARMHTTPTASIAAADAIQSSWSRSSSSALRSRTTRDTTDAIRAAATSTQPTVSSGSDTARLPRSSPTTNSPGRIVSVPTACRTSPAAATHTTHRQRGESRRPSGARRKTMICAVNAGQPSNGPAQAATWAQYVDPGPSAVEHPHAVGVGGQGHRQQAGRRQQPAQPVPRVARDDQRAHDGVPRPGQR